MSKGTDIFIISGKKKSFRVGAFIITADSVPDFDNWGWDDYWTCSDWKRWHELNVAENGRAVANEKFISYWSTQDGFMAPYNWCKYDSTFATYFANQGIDVGWLFSHLVVTTQNVGDNVLSSTESISEGVNTIATVAKYIAPFAAIGAAVWAIDKWVYPIFSEPKRK